MVWRPLRSYQGVLKISRVDAQVRVIDLHSQGYGLQLIFSDGHDRGIYPWPYLAQLAPEPTGI
ncbi:DUF971 domain-containing protein [Pseudomonas moorei]|nr:DUF971 domain-containing protein [Pseudomonas moorei]